MARKMWRHKITKAGQVSIPAEVRERWNAFTVLIVDEGERLTLRPAPDNPIEALRGILAGKAKNDHSRRSQAALACRGQRHDGTQMAQVLRRVVVDTGPIVSVLLGDAHARRVVGAGRTRLRRHGGHRRRGSGRLDRHAHRSTTHQALGRFVAPTLRRSRQRGRSPGRPRSFRRATTTGATATSRSRTASLSQPQFRTPTSRRRTRRSRGLPERRGST